MLDDTEHFGWTDVVRDGDLQAIVAPIDVLGVNYYYGDAVMVWIGDGRIGSSLFVGLQVLMTIRDLLLIAMGWEVQFEGFIWLLLWLYEEHLDLLLAVTENGAVYDDVVAFDGMVDDFDWLAYIADHLWVVHVAREVGADVRGYFVWFLLDNFEWVEGYAKRFGLVHVDYASQRRTFKVSARWYVEVCRTGIVLGTERLR